MYNNNQNPNTSNLESIQTEGLPNIGNTCFINAIVHCLFSSKSFQSNLMYIQSKQPLIQTLQNIFKAMKKCRSMKIKIDLMRNFAKQLSKALPYYNQNSQQDALRFFIDFSSLINEAFSGDMFYVSYQKICQNQAKSEFHKNQFLYICYEQLFVDKFQQECEQCSKNEKLKSYKHAYLTNLPKNLLTFGQDHRSSLSPNKLAVVRPFFFILYHDKSLNPLTESIEKFKVLKYRLKSRALYRGNCLTGHYIAIRKLTQTRIIKSSFYHQKLVYEESDEYFKFDDHMVKEIDQQNPQQKDLSFTTKFSIYELDGQPIDLKAFEQLYRRQFKQRRQHIQSSVKQSNLYKRQTIKFSQYDKEVQNNMRNVLLLYDVLLSLQKKTTTSKPQNIESKVTDIIDSGVGLIQDNNNSHDQITNFHQNPSNKDNQVQRDSLPNKIQSSLPKYSPAIKNAFNQSGLIKQNNQPTDIPLKSNGSADISRQIPYTKTKNNIEQHRSPSNSSSENDFIDCCISFCGFPFNKWKKKKKQRKQSIPYFDINISSQSKKQPIPSEPFKNQLKDLSTNLIQQRSINQSTNLPIVPLSLEINRSLSLKNPEILKPALGKYHANQQDIITKNPTSLYKSPQKSINAPIQSPLKKQTPPKRLLFDIKQMFKQISKQKNKIYYKTSFRYILQVVREFAQFKSLLKSKHLVQVRNQTTNKISSVFLFHQEISCRQSIFYQICYKKDFIKRQFGMKPEKYLDPYQVKWMQDQLSFQKNILNSFVNIQPQTKLLPKEDFLQDPLNTIELHIKDKTFYQNWKQHLENNLETTLKNLPSQIDQFIRTCKNYFPQSAESTQKNYLQSIYTDIFSQMVKFYQETGKNRC